MNTEAEAVAQIVSENMNAPQVLEVERDGELILLSCVPSNMTARDMTKELDARLPAPRRRTGTIAVKSLESFNWMVNRHKSDATVVYANDAATPTITAVLNDHFPKASGTPGHRDHRIVYSPELSPEWLAWVGQDGKSLSSSDFAEHLEEHSLDMLDPGAGVGAGTQRIIDALGVKVAPPSVIRGLARDLTVRVNSRAKDARNLQSGEAQIVFESAHTDEAGKPLQVPGAFLIAVPIYRGGPGYVFVARLRYRFGNAGLTWSYSLAQTDLAKREVMAEMIASIVKTTECLVVEGQAG